MPPRKSKPSRPPPPSKTLVLDNGAYTLKAGLVLDDDDNNDADAADHPQPRMIPNCIARDRDRKTYVASELSRCTDFSEAAFRRPVEKGFIVNWEAQREIWEREFFDEGWCDPRETRLLLAEPPNALPVLTANCDQMVFEEFGFASYYRAHGPSLNAWTDVQGVFSGASSSPTASTTTTTTPAEAVLVVDSGYSSTTVTPVLQGRPLHPAARRLDVGGKLLTNHLTRLLSLRHYDMRNEPWIVNEMKEAACFVSRDFEADLEACWKGTRGDSKRRAAYLAGSGGIARDYVLPDFEGRPRGLLREYDPGRGARAAGKLAGAGAGGGGGLEAIEDVLTLRNERFAVPEILFHPSDIGLRQSGLPNLVWDSLQQLPVGLWPAMLANIVVVGGSALLEGFAQRLQDEVRKIVPDECVVRVGRAVDPVTNTWRGGFNFVRSGRVKEVEVTRAEYEEFGSAWAARKIATGSGD